MSLHWLVFLRKVNKRYFSEAMDIDEEYTPRISKKKNIGKEGQQLVQVKKTKGKKKQMKIKGLAFEIQEYTFAKILEGATNNYKS